MEPLDLFTHRQVLSVSDLVGQLKKTAEDLFDFVWVEGEISGLRQPGSGHFYFALKDDKAMIRAVLFRHQAGMLRFSLEEGQSVLCQGRVSVYQPRGEIQLVVDTVEPRGAGALALAFEQTKKRLADEGLFDEDKKKPLPDLPQRVAVITSPQGAAVRDFLRVLHQRFERIQVAVYPSLVQGERAAGQMTRALEELAEWGWPQVIVLTRGGGSPEDLWAFNDPDLARAIAACPIPVVSAVGHEVDVTISDLTADLRAPTPTAAAELIAAPMAELAARLEGLSKRLARGGDRLIAYRRSQLKGLQRGLTDPRRALAQRRLRVDDLLMRAAQVLRNTCHQGSSRIWRLRERLRASRPDHRLAQMQARRQELSLRLASSMAALLSHERSRLEKAAAGLGALGPMAVLARGFALVSSQEGVLLRRAAQAKPGELIDIRLDQGRLLAKVEKVLD